MQGKCCQEHASAGDSLEEGSCCCRPTNGGVCRRAAFMTVKKREGSNAVREKEEH